MFSIFARVGIVIMTNNNRNQMIKTILTILFYLPLIVCSQESYVKHDYKKFIDCRINRNIEADENGNMRLEDYKDFIDREIVILTTDEARKKFLMRRGFIRVRECNGVKSLYYDDSDKSTLPNTLNWLWIPVLWDKYVYSYFAGCYDVR